MSKVTPLYGNTIRNDPQSIRNTIQQLTILQKCVEAEGFHFENLL